MRILSYMITKNEAGRYLEEVLGSVLEQVDWLCVYDDQSTDRTKDILHKMRVPHIVRAPKAPSFLEDESLFRQRAWRLMESLFLPRPGDWVLTLDADEVLRANGSLRDLCGQAESQGHDALRLKVHELWSPSEVRTDGFWGSIQATRFAEWKPNGQFTQKAMGGGSLPDYVQSVGETSRADILHYGYVKLQDRQSKYTRYSKRQGHSSQHIKSILAPPILDKLPPLV